MKAKATVTVAALLVILAFFTGRVISDDQKPADKGVQQPSPEDMKAMMDKWLATIKPGQHHQALQHFVGSWKTTTKMWMGGPGTPPTETAGRSDVRWVLGKRFILEEHHGGIMMPDATGQMKKQPYEGIGMTGYDAFRKMYVSTWASNQGTNLLTMKGIADPSGKVFRSYGEMDEPMLDTVGRTVKYVTRIVNDDKHIFSIYDLHVADDYKVIEIVYDRL